MTTQHFTKDEDIVHPEGDWLALSARFTQAVNTVATSRQDLIVKIAPGAGHGAPACFHHVHTTIEVDGNHLGANPATADPRNISDRARYAPSWGTFVHEAGHADHSHWVEDVPDSVPADILSAAKLLEEPRIEAAHVAERPQDRDWLRASAAKFVLSEIQDDLAQGDKQGACHSAALILGRRDGDVLDQDEVQGTEKIIESILGKDDLAKLRQIWQAALGADDNDAATMVGLGKKWSETVREICKNQDSSPQKSGDSAQELAEEVASMAQQVKQDSTPKPQPAVPPKEAASREEERQARQEAKEEAEKIFGTSTSTPAKQKENHYQSRKIRWRTPTDQEKRNARQLTVALRHVYKRERARTVITSAVPPGRLRMRHVLTRDAERATGATPTATPFKRTQRASTPEPPLRVGVCTDISSSMDAFARETASASWALSKAVHMIPDARTAMTVFGESARAVIWPRKTPEKVPVFTDENDTTHLDEAIKALDGSLGLSLPGAARLLVIMSDMTVRDSEQPIFAKVIQRLITSGCQVVLIQPARQYSRIYGLPLKYEDWPEKIRGITIARLGMNEENKITEIIARASIAALKDG